MGLFIFAGGLIRESCIFWRIKMKKSHVWLGMFAVLVFGLAIGGCASAPVGADLSPSDSQAVVTVVRGSARSGAAIKWVIMIDGVEAGRVGNNGTTRILVDNGQRSIQIVWSTVASDTLEFTADSNELFFGAQHVYVNHWPAIDLKAR